MTPGRHRDRERYPPANREGVNGFFDLVSQSLSQNPQNARITYQGTYGYPVSINIDPTDVPGDEIVYKVTRFEVIP